MDHDGVALVSAAHPPEPWPWYPPLSGFNHLDNDIDPFSVETIEIDLPPDLYAGRQYSRALARSYRSELVFVRASVINAWTRAEWDQWVETGKQPRGKEFGT